MGGADPSRVDRDRHDSGSWRPPTGAAKLPLDSKMARQNARAMRFDAASNFVRLPLVTFECGGRSLWAGGGSGKGRNGASWGWRTRSLAHPRLLSKPFV